MDPKLSFSNGLHLQTTRLLTRSSAVTSEEKGKIAKLFAKLNVPCHYSVTTYCTSKGLHFALSLPLISSSPTSLKYCLCTPSAVHYQKIYH